MRRTEPDNDPCVWPQSTWHTRILSSARLGPRPPISERAEEKFYVQRLAGSRPVLPSLQLWEQVASILHRPRPQLGGQSRSGATFDEPSMTLESSKVPFMVYLRCLPPPLPTFAVWRCARDPQAHIGTLRVAEFMIRAGSVSPEYFHTSLNCVSRAHPRVSEDHLIQPW